MAWIKFPAARVSDTGNEFRDSIAGDPRLQELLLKAHFNLLSEGDVEVMSPLFAPQGTVHLRHLALEIKVRIVC